MKALKPAWNTVAAFLWLCGSFATAGTGIRGKITAGEPGPLIVWSLPVPVRDDGVPQLPTKEELFASSVRPGSIPADSRGRFALPVPPGLHCVFAFADQNQNGRWDPAVPEAFGWYTSQPAGAWEPISVVDGSEVEVTLQVRSPRPFPTSQREAAGGRLTSIRGHAVLQLKGTASQRGYAHGFLIADQIVDFFRFYILEDKLRSAAEYETGFARFLTTHFAWPRAFVEECEAVITGMQASGADLFLPELNREFSLTDLYAINAYIETRAMVSSCTQFAAWGERTRETDVDGGMITGRNMDGEIDVRKVTVSHFLLMAVDPDEPGQKRFVSMMWPGFVATISGFNEDGLCAMENAGLTGPGPVVNRLVPFSWTMRESLATLGADASPASVQRLMDSFDNAAGGSCGPGCVTLFAVPAHGQSDPAFVVEGDRFGEAMRTAESAWPRVPEALVASNHHLVYGVDPSRPGKVFGRTPSFSSLWRYQAGASKLEAWHRTNRRIGTAEMRELLQTVAHGTTEYAIITRPNQREFDVATASMSPELWDAPYRQWTSFTFEDVFP